jgi:hypothetical protein
MIFRIRPHLPHPNIPGDWDVWIIRQHGKVTVTESCLMHGVVTDAELEELIERFLGEFEIEEVGVSYG